MRHSEFLLRRDLRRILSATKRFDQLNARHHALHSKTYRCLLVGRARRFVQRGHSGKDICRPCIGHRQPEVSRQIRS